MLGQHESIAHYVAECREMGINLLPPNINESGAVFTVSGNDLRYGLVAVKNIGHGFIDEVTTEREENGAFKSFEDFCRRMYGGELNRRAVESLIKSGCFDGLGAHRRQLMMICQSVIDDVAEHKRRNVEGQLDLFGLSGGVSEIKDKNESFNILEIPDIPEYSKSELIRMEREVTGLYLSGHPMDEYRDIAKRYGAVNIGDVLADFAREEGNEVFKDNQKVVLAGVIEAVQTKPTRNNTLMAYITLDDGSGSIELLAFQRAIDDAGVYMHPEEVVIINGKLSERDDKDPQVVIDMLKPMKHIEENGKANDFISNQESRDNRLNHVSQESLNKHNKCLYVKLSSEKSPEYEHLKLVQAMFPGREKMIIHFEDTKKNVSASCIIHEALIQELTDKFGEANVVVK